MNIILLIINLINLVTEKLKTILLHVVKMVDAQNLLPM